MRLWAIVVAVATTVAAVVAVNALLLGFASGGGDRVGNLSPRASLNLRPASGATQATTTTTRTTTNPLSTSTSTTTTGTTTDDHGGRGRGRGRGGGDGRDD